MGILMTFIPCLGGMGLWLGLSWRKRGAIVLSSLCDREFTMKSTAVLAALAFVFASPMALAEALPDLAGREVVVVTENAYLSHPV